MNRFQFDKPLDKSALLCSPRPLSALDGGEQDGNLHRCWRARFSNIKDYISVSMPASRLLFLEPGDGYSNVRRPLLHTLNLADMLPVTSVWAGLRENPSGLMPKHSPPLLYAATTGATPYRFNLHVSDTGHTLIVGPTGAGKSTALGLLAAQWFRYPNAKVFAFDRGYSSWLLTVAAAGSFYDLAGPRTHLAFCPLAALDEDSDLTCAVGWVEALCELNGLKFTPRHRNAVAEAIGRLRLSPTRTLTELSANVQDTDIRDALEHFTVSGPLGSLLDAEHDLLSDGRFLTFEMENLLLSGHTSIQHAQRIFLAYPSALPGYSKLEREYWQCRRAVGYPSVR